jgi:hypothetical protein
MALSCFCREEEKFEVVQRFRERITEFCGSRAEIKWILKRASYLRDFDAKISSFYSCCIGSKCFSMI